MTVTWSEWWELGRVEGSFDVGGEAARAFASVLESVAPGWIDGLDIKLVVAPPSRWEEIGLQRLGQVRRRGRVWYVNLGAQTSFAACSHADFAVWVRFELYSAVGPLLPVEERQLLLRALLIEQGALTLVSLEGDTN